MLLTPPASSRIHSLVAALDCLTSAKREEMIQAGVPNLIDTAVKTEQVRLKKNQGEETTTELIELLYSAADVIGVPLLKDETKVIGKEQKKRIPCIQDPPSVEVYTITGYLTKDEVKLPIPQCDCGSAPLK